MQVAGDLNVANEAGVELHWRPSGTVVGVNDVECAATDVEVVIGNVHPPVVRAGWVVIHPHARAVVGRAVVRARTGGPGDAIRRSPQANALGSAAGRHQVAGKPHAQVRVVHHDRVAQVGAVAGAKGQAGVPGGSVIG